MQTVLHPRDVARAIQEVLDGSWTRIQLGKWAFQAQVNEDTGTRPFEQAYWEQIKEAVYDLMFMEEGPEFGLEDVELHEMMERLNALKPYESHDSGES